MLYLVLIVFAMATRLMPHAANIAPVAALALFAGATAWQAKTPSGKIFAGLAPAIALLVSDLIIGTYTWQVMAAVYASYAASFALGLWVRKHYAAGSIIFAALAGSILFYLVTNAAVWAFTPMYAKNLTGLIESYTLALPFFRNSLIGDLLYTGIFFGAYELAKGKIALHSLNPAQTTTSPKYSA